MKGQKCANCGYYMSFTESVFANIGERLFGKSQNVKGIIGVNTISNINKLKCPKCGENGRWIREDE